MVTKSGVCDQRPTLYWYTKLHKKPYKSYVPNLNLCIDTELAIF